MNGKKDNKQNALKTQESIKKLQHKDQLHRSDLDKMLFKVNYTITNIRSNKNLII